jgi:hypothetical protein
VDVVSAVVVFTVDDDTVVVAGAAGVVVTATFGVPPSVQRPLVQGPVANAGHAEQAVPSAIIGWPRKLPAGP